MAVGGRNAISEHLNNKLNLIISLYACYSRNTVKSEGGGGQPPCEEAEDHEERQGGRPSL
eukprot:6347562-Heterocapsa_arctica.AAC.1